MVWHKTLSFYFWSRFHPQPTPTFCLPSYHYLPPTLLPPPSTQPYLLPTYSNLPSTPIYLPLPTLLPIHPTFSYLPTPISYLPSYQLLPPTYPTHYLLFILLHISHYLYLTLPLPSLTICFFLYFNYLHLYLWPLKPSWSHDLSSSSSSPFLTCPINTVISLHCIFSTTTFIKLFMIYSPIFLLSPLCFGMGNSKGDGKPLNPPRPCVDFKHKSCLVHSPGLLFHW